MKGIGVRVRGIRVDMRGMPGIREEMQIIKVEMREWRESVVGIKEMQGVRVVIIGMQGMGMEMRRIRFRMR